MKPINLTDLNPTWIERPLGRVVGVRFTCPKDDGAGPHREGHAVCVLFANPPDGGPPYPDDDQCPGNSKGRRWQRLGGDHLGSSFEDLTLAPSVDCTRGEGCDKSDHSQCSHTHCWHGSVTNGEVT